jgi:ketosteroid isomerase-like protein
MKNVNVKEKQGANSNHLDLEAEKKMLKDVHVKMLVDHKTNVDEEMFYMAEEAFIIPPKGPIIKGQDTIRKILQQMVKTEITSFGDRNHGPSNVWISKSGDLAYDQGKFKIVRKGPDGITEEKGYYVTLYKKVDDQWKFVGQIWNNVS